jgi:spore coat protein H
MRDDAPDPEQEPWTQRGDGEESLAPLTGLLRVINRTPQHELQQTFERQLELEDYVLWLAVDAAISNTTVEDSRSFFIKDAFTQRWTYVPWDLNNASSLYSRTSPVGEPLKVNKPLFNFSAFYPRDPPRWSTLNTRVFDTPALRAKFLASVRDLLQTRFVESELDPRIDAMVALLAPHLREDRFVDRAYVARSGDFLKAYVRGRRQHLLGQLDAVERAAPSGLVIDRVGIDAGGKAFVELYNAGTEPQSLRGLLLTGRLRSPEQHRLPSVTLAPGEVLTLRQGAGGSEDLKAILEPEHAEVGLLNAADYTPVDLLYPGPLEPGAAYGRTPRGSENLGPVSP